MAARPASPAPPPRPPSRKKNKTRRMINLANAIQPSNSDALLTYTPLTDPNPLQVNGPGILTLVVSKSTRETITCSEIKVTLLVGKAAQDLTTDATSIGVQLPSSSWGVD